MQLLLKPCVHTIHCEPTLICTTQPMQTMHNNSVQNKFYKNFKAMFELVIMITPSWCFMVAWIWKVYLPYCRKFSLVQIFVEMGPYPSEEIFTAFIFAERKRDALSDHIPTRWWPCPICTCNWRNDTEWCSKVSLCNNGLLFPLCGALSNYKSIKTARRRRQKNLPVEQKDFACWSWTWQLQIVSYGFIGILYTY